MVRTIESKAMTVTCKHLQIYTHSYTLLAVSKRITREKTNWVRVLPCNGVYSGVDQRYLALFTWKRT